MQVKCIQCSHEWNYKGKAIYVTCPSCRKLQKTYSITEDKVKK